MNNTIATHPGTGELLPIAELADEDLADLVIQMKTMTDRIKSFRGEVDVELRRRLERHQRQELVVGGFQIIGGVRRTAEWDPDELELVLQDLVDQGVLQAGELTGVITRDPVVSRREADRVVKQLDGEARRAVEGCREWKESPKPVDVVVVQRDPELQP